MWRKKELMREIFQDRLFRVFHVSLLVLFLCTSTSLITRAQTENIDSLYNIVETTQNDSIRYNTLFDIAIAYRSIDQDSSLILLEEVIKEAKQSDLPDLAYYATLFMSSVYKVKGSYATSTNLLLEQLKQQEQQNNLHKQARCLTDLGEVCRAAQQLDEGVAYVHRALKLIGDNKPSRPYAFAQNRLAALYYEQEKFELCRVYADSSLQMAKQIGYERLIPNSLDILGATLKAQKNYAESIELYHFILNCHKVDLQNDADKTNVYLNLARTFNLAQQYDSALYYTRIAHDLAHVHNVPVYVENTLVLFAQIYFDKGDYKNAYIYLDSTVHVRNGLFNENKNQQISDLNKKYETEKKEQQIEKQQLIIENKLHKNQLLTAIVSLMLILLIAIVLSRLRMKRKNRLLFEKNEEIRKQRDELQFFANELESANKQKDKFFSIIAHDLRSPFNSLIGMSEILNKNLEDLSTEDIREIASSFHKTSDNTFNLLNNLLEWSRTQTNRVEFNPEKLAINKVIQDVVEFNRPGAEAKSIKITFNPVCDEMAMADINMLNTIMRNLITNAIKFTHHGQIRISCQKQELSLLISVEDSGIGIPKEKISQLFSLEDNYSTEGTHGETGTGLGLLLCHEFVKKHNGELSVESEEGKGSIFSFTLPMA